MPSPKGGFGAGNRKLQHHNEDGVAGAQGYKINKLIKKCLTQTTLQDARQLGVAVGDVLRAPRVRRERQHHAAYIYLKIFQMKIKKPTQNYLTSLDQQ